MAISTAQLRAAVSAQIATLSGYKQVLMLPEYFTRTSNSIAHKGYAVSVATSNAIPERQRRAVGLVLDTVVRVQIAYRIRPHDVMIDYDAALDAESEVIGKILNTYVAIQAGVSIRFVRAVRSAPDSSEYLISALEFSALHTISIT